MEHFINEGFGWLCQRCQQTTARALETEERARFFREGEAEEREVKLSEPALARWRDDARAVLVCPHCGIEERMGGE